MSQYRQVNGMFASLTRSQYDELVCRYPRWMASVWPKIAGRWYLSGPTFDDRFHRRVMLLVLHVAGVHAARRTCCSHHDTSVPPAPASP